MGRSKRAEIPLGLVLVRFVSGVLIARQGWRWITDEVLRGDALRDVVSRATADLPVPVAWWGDEVLLANADATALFWRWGALIVGVALATGALVRTAGLLGVLLGLHGLVFGAPEDFRLLLLLAACLLACAATNAGRRLGMDALMEDRLPPWLTLQKRSSSPFLG